MTLAALILILLSVILHASWHFLSKRGNPSYGFFIVFSFSLFLTMLPLLLISGINPFALPPRLLLLAFAGGFAGMLCDIGLCYAYRHAEISIAYPVSRALPVIMTALVTSVFGLGKELNPIVMIGIAVIFAGCIIMPFSKVQNFRSSSFLNKGVFGVILAACATTSYTITDSYGIKLMFSSVSPDVPRLLVGGSYSCIREFTVFLGLFALAAARRKEREKLNMSLLKSPHPYLAGAFAAYAYLLVLLAMNLVTNVSYIQAFRQLSLPVGMALGFIILKEKFTMPKIVALALILGGLAVVYLG